MMGPQARIRYRNDVTADHIGQRVSVRSTDAAGTPRDVVGRLLAIDAEVLLIVDRAARLHVISRPQVIASKVVPAHPRLPAEPDVGGRDAPLERDAARLVVIQASQVLLIAHHPRPDETVWTAPGGGLNDAEDPRRAAERELLEETGVALSAGSLVMRRTATFPFRGVWITQHEQWFLAEPTTDDQQSAPSGLSDTPEDPSAASGGPSAASGGPSAASGGPSAASGGPSAASGGPSAAPEDPSVASGGPSAAHEDPSAAPGDPSAAPGQASDPATSTTRWWPVDELAATQERIEPPDLPAMIRSLIETGPPDQPWEFGPTTSDDSDDATSPPGP